MLLSACGNTGQTETTTAATTAAEASAPVRVIEGDTTGLTPAVWRVTDPQSGNSLNMMGTIHIIPGDKAVIPQYAMDIYNESDGIAVEYDVSKIQTDMVVQMKYMSYFVLNDGTLITEHLSPETYEKAKTKLTELGLYNQAFESYNAQYWENLISTGMITSIEGMKQSGVDQYFIGVAKEDGKEVRSIEELETQMNAITAGSDALSEYNINAMITYSSEEMKESFMELYNVWASGDTEACAELTEAEDDEMPEDIKADYAVYNRALLYDRNVGMADRAEEYIKNGDNLFYMVGFAHFSGEGNVLELLEARGYTVEKIH